MCDQQPIGYVVVGKGDVEDNAAILIHATTELAEAEKVSLTAEGEPPGGYHVYAVVPMPRS